MRTTGLGTSAFLVAVGAILAWAVTDEIQGVDVRMVGLILFVVGLVLAVVTLLSSMSGRRTVIQTERDAVVNGRPVTERQQDVVVEREPY